MIEFSDSVCFDSIYFDLSFSLSFSALFSARWLQALAQLSRRQRERHDHPDSIRGGGVGGESQERAVEHRGVAAPSQPYDAAGEGLEARGVEGNGVEWSGLDSIDSTPPLVSRRSSLPCSPTLLKARPVA